MENRATQSETPEVRLLGKAMEVVSEDAGGTFSMEKLKSDIQTQDFKTKLLNKIKGDAELLSKFPDAQSAVSALEQQLDSVDEMLKAKYNFAEEVKEEGFFSKVWSGTKNVVSGTWNVAKKVLTHPVVLTAVLAVGGFFLYKYLSEISSRAHEFAGRYERETQEVGNRATPTLARPAAPGLTNTSGGNVPQGPAGSTEEIDPYFGGFSFESLQKWLQSNQSNSSSGTPPPAGEMPPPPPPPPPPPGGGVLGVPIRR